MSLRDELNILKSKYSNQLTKDEALDLALEAAQLHIKFLNLVASKAEKDEIRENCNLILGEAERIKTSNVWQARDDFLIDFEPLQPSTSGSVQAERNPKLQPLPQNATSAIGATLSAVASRTTPTATILLPPPVNSRRLSSAEEILLLQGSKLHGFKFPPWKTSHASDYFDVSTTRDSFIDEPEIDLSDAQRKILAGWKRPSDALPPPSWPSNEPPDKLMRIALPSMTADREVDFVQDAATDCSVVASLAAITARAQKGCPRLLSNIIFPYDEHNDRPAMSASGKYIVRLNFNGSARRVVIDDRLPVSKTTRIMHVVDRNNPSLLWPALLEKSYLKTRGGYDFPGSNSGTDLWVLLGWIPEQVVLQHDETNVSQLWPRISRAFVHGDVIITLGTGKMTSQTEADSGLAGEHDYAVIDLKDDDQRCHLLIKNPWLNSTSWRDHRKYTNSPNDEAAGHNSNNSVDTAKFVQLPHRSTSEAIPSGQNPSSLGPGTFWMEMSDVMQYFESIYLNWNPGLFKLRQDIHFTWDLRPPNGGLGPAGSFTRNPQQKLTCDQGGTVWLVLSKHFKDKTDQLGAKVSSPDESYISLYAFSGTGQRVSLSKGATKQGFYVDSPQALLQLELPPKSSYTIVASVEDLPNALHTFTLSAFSNSPITLETAQSQFTMRTKTHSSWTQDTAGGNSHAATYAQNPQLSFVLPSRSAVSLVLETLVPNVSVHVKLLHGYGQRVFNMTAKDIIVDSGNYRRGCAQARFEDLDAGTYTIICSTFEAGQQGSFTLLAESMTQHTVRVIPRAGAGRIRTRFAEASFGVSCRVLAAPVSPLRLTRVNFTAKYVHNASAIMPVSKKVDTTTDNSDVSVHPPTRLTIELGRGPDRRILIASSGGAFSDSTSGMRTEDVDLNPDMVKKKEMWLVLERLGGFEGMARLEERVAVDMWADAENALDVGVWREWER